MNQVDLPDARTAPLVPGLPLLGSALDAAREPHRFFARCHARHGPVFRVRYPGQELLLIAGLEANRLFALEGARLFDAGRTYARVSRELGTTTYPNAHDGPTHRDLRRAVAASLSAQAIEPFLPRIVDAVAEAARGWPVGSTARVGDLVAPLVADAVAVCTAGRPLPPGLVRDVTRYATMMGVVGVGAAFPEWTLYVPPVRRARARLAAFVDEAFADHRRAGPGERPPDVLDALLALQAREPARVDAAALRALAMLPAKNAGIYLYRLVSFVLWELLARPDLRQRVQVEVAYAFARGAPTGHDLERLPTLQGTILEALRLYPMALALPRHVAEPFSFAGYRFAAGQTIYVAGPAVHLDPDVYPDPEHFDPDRHGPDRNEHRRPHAFAPFGLGAHACVARAYTRTLAAAVVAALLRHVDLAVEPRDHRLRVRGFPNPIPEARFRVRVLEHAVPTVLAAAPPLLSEGLAPALALLDDAQRAAVLADLREEEVAAGTVLFEQGDVADRFHVIRRGQVEVVVGERVVARLGAGEAFGEIGLLQGVPRTATVRAVRDTTVLTLGREAFLLLAVEGELTRGELVRVMQRRALATALSGALPDLDPESLARLGEGVEVRPLAAGEVVVRQGDPSDAFFVLLQGVVEVLNERAGVAPIRVATVRAVDHFGEAGLLEDTPRAATVRVTGDGPATVLVLPRAAFAALVGTTQARDDLADVATARLLALARG